MLDIFILVVTAWSLFSGWRNGLLKELVSTVGFLVGLLVAVAFYSAFGRYLSVDGTEANAVTSLLAFFILWVAVPIVLGAVANMLTKALKAVCLGTINSILGAVVSFIKFFILLGCILTAMSALGILNAERTEESLLYRPIQANFSAFVKNAFGITLSSDDASFRQDRNEHDNAAASSDTTWIDV